MPKAKKRVFTPKLRSVKFEDKRTKRQRSRSQFKINLKKEMSK